MSETRIPRDQMELLAAIVIAALESAEEGKPNVARIGRVLPAVLAQVRQHRLVPD